MAAKTQNIAKTALVIATQEDGSHVYLYQGQPVPASVSADEVKRLKSGGFIETVKIEGSDDESDQQQTPPAS